MSLRFTPRDLRLAEWNTRPGATLVRDPNGDVRREARDWPFLYEDLERDRGTARLEEAVAAYREVLKEYTRENAPYYWDLEQRNLESALKLLEERKRQTRKEPRARR